ncbi:MAG: hypothetical protein ACI4D4_08600 [Lachnospira sp.]
MHDIIEHYGKVVVALAGVLAALLLTAAVVSIINGKTTGAIESLSYEDRIYDAIEGVESNVTQEAVE